MTIRPAKAQDLPVLVGSGLLSRDAAAPHAIQASVEEGSLVVAETNGELVGLALVDRSFFGRGFVRLLHVQHEHQRRGLGGDLLAAAVRAAGTTRVFTSTNLSNHPMQQLLVKTGWVPCGLVHGLDRGDPELFYFTDA